MGNGLETIVSVSPKGRILAVCGNAALQSFLKTGRGFIDHVYLNDRIPVLTFFDSLRQTGYAGPVTLHLQNQGKISAAYRLSLRTLDDNGQFGLALLPVTPDKALPKPQDAPSSRPDIALSEALAHEMRTPLNAIIGFSDFLLQEVGAQFENETQRDYVTLIRQSGRHLLQMVNAMLADNTAGAAFADEQRSDAGMLIGESIAVMAGALRQRRFSSDLGQAASCRVAVGDVDMRRIVTNLVSNAVKYTAVGGTITLRTALSADGRLVLSVRDNGIGISSKQLAIIGTPFQRADNARASAAEGCGLGLALVRGIVISCGGEVTIKSREGRGTLVRVFLPLMQDVGKQQGNDGGGRLDENVADRYVTMEQNGADNGPKEKETRKTA